MTTQTETTHSSRLLQDIDNPESFDEAGEIESQRESFLLNETHVMIAVS